MKRITFTIIWLAGCDVEPCHDNPNTEEVSCDGEICHAIGDDETGAEAATCTPYTEPVYDNTWLTCAGEYSSEAEHLSDSGAHNYGVTDYAFEAASQSRAVLFDYLVIPPVDIPGESWWTWSENWLTAVPGVVTHEALGHEYAAWVSRGCCAQRVVDGHLATPVHDPECTAGYLVNDNSRAYCLDMLDGSGAGLCVYPCGTWLDGIAVADSNDCPNPAGEFCDLTRPDPAGLAPGVCRYKSMPAIPTPLDEVGDLP